MFGRLKELFRNLVIYGLGDTATQIISVFLLPLYARYLSTTDYGVLALLLTVEVVTKVVFRWGIDGAFMRLYFDCPDQPARQRLASTQFYFLLTANGALLAAGLVGASWLGPYLFKTSQYDWTMRLVLINTFVVSFYYLPFHVMRIEGKTPTFISLTFARSLATILMRLLLVIAFRWGVHGVVLSDIVVTCVFTVVLARWFAPLIRLVFSRALLRESLRFGLPRLPHGVAQQVIGSSDRYVLARYVALNQVGIYSTGSTFGQGLKLFLSSFEQAWAPFYFGVMREPDAKTTFARVTTYSVLILALLVTGLAACAHDLVSFLMPPAFLPAAQIVPWVGLGVGLQGLYLLTSIGLNITKRTEYYPIATAIAAATSVGANLVLVPMFGIVGAAWANVIAYGTLAFVSWRFSNRFYPIAYETARLARILAAAAIALVASRLIVPTLRPLAGLLAHGTVVVLVFAGVLVVTGFFVRHEIEEVVRLVSRVRRRKVVELPSDTTELAGEIVTTPSTDLAIEVESTEDTSGDGTQAAAAGPPGRPPTS